MSSATVPSDDINRIIIGLGGQGSRVVNEVRKAVLAQGQGTLPAGLEFIAIDSDRIALTNLDSVPEDQRIHLAAPDDNITETIVPWLPHEFRPKAGGGCGMQRLTGKAMYLVHRHRILETVRAVARKLRQRTQVSNFMVVLVNAFGGGTGSGMAIDFSLDLRGDLKEITGQQPLMFGVGILPSRSETIQRANGVALLKELHFLLAHKEPVLVGGRDHSNPFELYFLVGREVMGIERDDDLMKSIVRFTIDLGLIPSTSRDTAAAGKGAGWVDLQDIRTLVKGAGHMFSTFGYYRAAFPGEELLQYFEALDAIDALRKQIPSFATDLDAGKRTLEDKRIALAHAQEIYETAKARAARLRSNGILGANRPDLAKLFAAIGTAETALRKARRGVEAADEGMPALGEKRVTIEAQLKEWEIKAADLKRGIVEPVQSRTSYTVALTEEDVERFTRERHLVEQGTFRSLMETLGRMPEFHDRTMDVVGKNKVLYMPLLNYRMSFHTAAAFPPPVLASLRKHGFVRFDAAGNPIIADDHLWMVMAMLSSRPENIDANKVSARAFKETVEGHVARRAEVKIVPSATKRFEVVIHSWMVGVQVAPIAPGHPPRLKELEWLMPEYEQVAREGGLAQHHAFLYGDPLAFSQLASVPVDRISVAKTNEMITEFWGGYAPIDANARWLQLPPTLAEAKIASDDLARSAFALADATSEIAAGEVDLAALDRLSAALAKGTEEVEAFGRGFVEHQNALRERFASLVAQLERTHAPPRDPARLVAMEELAAEALAAAATAVATIEQLRADLPRGLRPEGHARGNVRFEHALALAEGGVARLHETTGATIDHLRELERLLQRAQAVARAKALAPFSGALHALPGKPLPIEMETRSNGNGHHAPAGAPTLQEELE